jgi:photosystem II stability/assembly factor-like uncharacterized protein
MSFRTESGLRIVVLVFISLLTQPAIAQWIQQPSPSGQVFERVRFFDASTGWITDDQSRIYKTSDGGVSWSIKDSVSGGFQTIGISSRDTVVYATWLGIPPYSSGIRYTSNSGDTWQTADSQRFYYTDLVFITPGIGFAVGAKPDSSFLQFAPLIRRSSNAGLSWETVLIGSYGDEIRGISFADASHGWAITFGGVVYHSTDAGHSWVTQSSLGVAPMRDIQFTTPDSGWAVGGISGTARVARTTDGGSSWSDTTFPGPSLLELQMLDSRIGWVVGPQASYVLSTTNGGNSWQRQQMIPSTGSGCYSISMVDRNLGWATSTGRVYMTTNGGTVDVNRHDKPPYHFSLDQNYPNPFNPMTTIGYDLPRRTQVNLTVFDLTGRKVAILVDGIEDLGRHERPFHTANLASGVYLFRLSTDGFVQTRKMVLQK